MKVLVTGVNGQLGYDVIKVLKEQNIDCLGADIQEFDITNYEQTNEFIKNYMPDVVVHCSAYTAVDKAEDNEELCYNVNAIGPQNIARICKEINAKMVFISTDYVFPGDGEKAYEVNSETGPKSVYGRTKLEGEENVKKILNNYFIVRISWVFGKNGANFVKTMLRLAQTHNELNVVCDQIGSPTYTKDLAYLLVDMLKTEKYGTYHATNEGYCSWAEFAQEIFKLSNLDVKVNFITSDKYPAKAKRPENSRMSKENLDINGFNRLPKWEDALKRYLVEISE